MDTRTLRRVAAALLLAVCGLAQATHFDLVDLDGKRHTVAAHKGKWVVMNIWATWCAPCIHEMPELESLSRARADLVVIGLAADGENEAKVRNFARALKVSYPIVAGNTALMNVYGIKAFPTTLVYDPDGKLVATRKGRVTRRDLESYLPPT
jgi:thiol-disulfide isomerase/thioredoxin